MNFYEWLHYKPMWKENLDAVDPYVFKELRMSKEEVEKVLEKLEEYNVFKSYQHN